MTRASPSIVWVFQTTAPVAACIATTPRTWQHLSPGLPPWPLRATTPARKADPGRTPVAPITWLAGCIIDPPLPVEAPVGRIDRVDIRSIVAEIRRQRRRRARCDHDRRADASVRLQRPDGAAGLRVEGVYQSRAAARCGCPRHSGSVARGCGNWGINAHFSPSLGTWSAVRPARCADEPGVVVRVPSSPHATAAADASNGGAAWCSGSCRAFVRRRRCGPRGYSATARLGGRSTSPPCTLHRAGRQRAMIASGVRAREARRQSGCVDR